MQPMNMTRGSVGVDPMAASRRSAADRPGAGMGRAGKVLVVEDEADVAEMIRYNLGKEGYDVRLAANGTDALRQVKEARPDVILLDIMVPHLNGWEICRRLKQDRDTQAIPVIMVTGRVEEGDKVLGFEMGADDYVTKPFSPRELVARVRAVSRRGRPGEDAAGQPVRAGDLEIDRQRFEVKMKGRLVELTRKEFDLLVRAGPRPGPGLRPRGAAGPGVGPGRLRRAADRRRPRGPAAGQVHRGARAGAGHRDGARSRLPVPGAVLTVNTDVTPASSIRHPLAAYFRPITRKRRQEESPMRRTWSIVPVLLLAVGDGRTARRGRRPDADERGGGHLPVPDLLEVVRGVHQGRPGRALQLSVDRERRRHPADHRADGRLRGLRRPDDRRAAQEGARRALPHPDRHGRGGGDLQPAREPAARVHGRRPRRHLPRQDHEVERRADQGAEPGGEPARPGDRGRAPLGRERHHLHLGRLPLQGQPRVGEGGRAGDVGEVAGGPRRQGQRGRGRPGEERAGLPRLRRAGLRDHQQAARGPHQEPGGQVRRADDREHDRGGGRGGEEHAGRLPGVAHERARDPTPTRSRASPGSWCTRSSRTSRRARPS